LFVNTPPHLNHGIVQTAAKGTNPFHINEPFNGIALSSSTHAGAQSGHPNFNNRVFQKLEEIRINHPNITPDLAREKLEELISIIRAKIATNPNTHINNLIF